MAAADRTYSFRAPGELGERIRAANELLARLAGAQQTDLAAWISRELQLAMLRRFGELEVPARDQSGFIRSAVELLVAATDKVATDLELARDYAEWAHDDPEAEALRSGALAAAASIWNDE